MDSLNQYRYILDSVLVHNTCTTFEQRGLVDSSSSIPIFGQKEDFFRSVSREVGQSNDYQLAAIFCNTPVLAILVHFKWQPRKLRQVDGSEAYRCTRSLSMALTPSR